MRSLIFWVALPFVMPQAIWLRRAAPRFKAARGEPVGCVPGEQPLRLIAIGDSIVAGVGAATLDRALVGRSAASLAQALGVGIEWRCIGSIGATSHKVAKQLIKRLPKEETDFFVLSVGVNDVTSLSTRKAWRASLISVLDALHEHSPGASIAVAGIPPLEGFPLLPQPLKLIFGLRGKSFDEVIRREIRRRSYCAYVPLDFVPDPSKFSADGFHPSESSYSDFGHAVAAAIVDKLAACGAGPGDSFAPEPLSEAPSC